jgi:hypothetical protein
MLNFCFCIRWIFRSRSAFCCVQGVKRRHTIFHARVDQYGFNKKLTGKHYAELVFLHSLGSAGHVLHSGTSGGEMSTHYF